MLVSALKSWYQADGLVSDKAVVQLRRYRIKKYQRKSVLRK